MMDETDLFLSKLLLYNSRTPYRTLADTLGLSVNAVHKRIQSMVEEKVIRGFTTKISLSSLGVFHILIHGVSKAESTYAIMEELGNHDSIYWIALAGGNYIYIGAHLRNIQELSALVEFVSEMGRMPNATVGIIHEDFSGKGKPIEKLLQPLDWEIVRSLRYDSRKATSSIAEEVHASSKTIRRRLKHLIDENLVEFSIKWYPSATNDITTTVHLGLGSISAKEVNKRFMIEYQPNVLFTWRFSNLPDQLIAFLWAPSMNKLRELIERMEGDRNFISNTPIILYAGNLYDTWRDRLVDERAGPSRAWQ